MKHFILNQPVKSLLNEDARSCVAFGIEVRISMAGLRYNTRFVPGVVCRRVELQHSPVRVGSGARGRRTVRPAAARSRRSPATRPLHLPVAGAQPLARKYYDTIITVIMKSCVCSLLLRAKMTDWMDVKVGS